jgi:hypothetical protein
MKNNLLKFYTLAFYFASTFILFAQETPGTNDEGGTMEGEEVAAPIDDYVWVLAAIGLIYVFLRIRAFANQSNIKS